MYVEGEGIGVAVVTPYGLEDGVTLYSLADVLGEDTKDFRLAGGEVLHRAVKHYG